jgi:hypothetical protein
VRFYVAGAATYYDLALARVRADPGLFIFKFSGDCGTATLYRIEKPEMKLASYFPFTIHKLEVDPEAIVNLLSTHCGRN